MDGAEVSIRTSQGAHQDPATGFANHDYITVRHFVEFIQILELQSPGINDKAICGSGMFIDNSDRDHKRLAA